MSDRRDPSYELAFPPPRARYVPDPVPARGAGEEEPLSPAPRKYRTQLLLFVVTVFSVFLAGAQYAGPPDAPGDAETGLLRFLATGWPFAIPLLAILLFHEFAHYIAARVHRVEASLPYFLPLPLMSPFGTLGAVIAMRGRIRSRNALLDIGASGPLAGMAVAIPMLVVGLTLSRVAPQAEGHYMQEGQSILYLALKRVVVGPIPDGYDVHLHPTAVAGWVGLLVTMLNLLPWGQLDGGHVAYALFGAKQDRYARLFRLALLPLFLMNLARFVLPVLRHRSDMPLDLAISNSMFWFTWFIVLGVISWLSGGAAHPPTEPGELSPRRRVVAIVTLALFLLLFMPAPLTLY